MNENERESLFNQWSIMCSRVRHLGDIVQNAQPSAEDLKTWKAEAERIHTSIGLLMQTTFYQAS